MKIYIASPLFHEWEKDEIDILVKYLRDMGNEVYSPKEFEVENAWDIPNAEWGKKVFDEDIKHLRECDKVVAIYYGLKSDTGTAWEMGFAYALGKPVEVINKSEEWEDISLMIANSCINNPWGECQNQT